MVAFIAGICMISNLASVLFSSVAQLRLTLCDPMDCSAPGFPVLHHLLEFTQSHVHWVSDAIQPSDPVIPFSCLRSCRASGSFPMSQLFSSCGQSTGISASVLPVNVQGWFPLGLIGLISLLSKGLSRAFCSTRVWGINSSVLRKDRSCSVLNMVQGFPDDSAVKNSPAVQEMGV